MTYTPVLAASPFWGALLTILTILGSLGIFLYGMKVMSEGIQKAAGGGMRKALATLTHNRVSSVFTGFFTTSLVQSSSATTVLVVSFVNAGLLTLVESIGVIMGANLGTTITAWLVAWIGKFSISKVALPIIGIGLPLFFVGKEKIKAIGESLIGFGLLFTGLAALKNAVPDLKSGVAENAHLQEQVINVIDFLNGFGPGSTVLFLIAGIILTVVVQSSSAAMAITITCAWNGWFGTDPLEAFHISAAVVMGENIGTTVTAWLASIGTSVNAKRAARAHFLFNVVGTIWAILAFGILIPFVWGLVDLFPKEIVEIKTGKGEVDNPLTVVAFAVALFHTMFNLLNIFLLVWFVPQIANLVQKWVKDPSEQTTQEQHHLRYISQTLVDLGELNIAEAENAIRTMSEQCVKMFNGFIDVFEHPKDDMSEQVKALKQIEDEADIMMQEITEYLVRCSSKDIGTQHASRIAGMLRITQELEECVDCIYRLVKLNERRYKKNRQFSPDQIESLREYAGNTAQFIQFADAHLLQSISDEQMNKAEEIKSTSIAMRKKLNKSAMKRMADGDVRLEMINIDINNHFEAIANHVLHVVQAGQSMHQSE
ncbi:Na/Pi cotransporter family protein [Verrucomicrobiaceae bacterium R5-34]|uniref:Na/Pi cotransporter family protein n=1 Tax=Oceaniferula flava TaxID=2800421 RepID=A0AAE2VCZ2_9BACT|nr:Na/Pi cotransporter family protein [Oceaniferula flavus]MBK1829699.1 Na/Pi cotransporter family protein [Verrucomicrobiaceae bacterium R5-34]MBK1853889.1 Na/Pi cotransporter family protein [Oceaniferula flavus]MBM1135195.1 Na/Pi cotransporter family protein [Oceaniferula flavus]